jgi:preprotein translocase subunit SecB
MKAKKSPLVLNSFLLLNHNYQFIQQEEIPSTLEIMEQYPIEIDFVIKEVNDGFYQLFIKIEINTIDKPLPGYKLFIEGVCIFSFDKSVQLSDNDKSALLHISGISIGINSLRNILSTITSSGPFGKYTLPSIDVNQLLEDKRLSVENQKISK